MKMMAVDDERLALGSFLRVLREVEPEADVVSFTESEDAFDYLLRNRVDIAFLDIQMSGLTGLALAEKCKSLCPTVNIIFVTGYSQYAMDALQLHVSGYLVKPVEADALRKELENLRFPLYSPVIERVWVRTFGNFDVFVDGQPLLFPTAKCKEALAYLIDRKGARVTYSELSGVLWENRPYNRTVQNNIHGTIFKLMKMLSEIGIAEIVMKGRKDIAIDFKKVNCDYYAALDGRREPENAFMGEYMCNYSWAETTLGELYHWYGK